MEMEKTEKTTVQEPAGNLSGQAAQEEKRLPTQEEVLREWIATREESRKETLRNYFRGMYPMMFVAGFFLLATAYQEGRRIRYLGAAEAGVPSILLTTVSFVLGAGLLFAGFRMAKIQKEERMREMEERLKSMEKKQREKETLNGQFRPGTIAEKAAMAARLKDAEEKEEEAGKTAEGEPGEAAEGEPGEAVEEEAGKAAEEEPEKAAEEQSREGFI